MVNERHFVAIIKEKHSRLLGKNQLYNGIPIFNGTIVRLALTGRKPVTGDIVLGFTIDQLFRDLYKRNTPSNTFEMYLRIF